MIRTFVLLGFLAAVPAADAQILATLTPQQIEEAIKIASNERDTDRLLRNYRLQNRGSVMIGTSDGPLYGVFTTPFTRIVYAARDAPRRYQKFTADDVTPEMLAPEIVVATNVKSFTAPSPGVAGVTAVVLMPLRSKNRSLAIHPSRVEASVEKYANLFGASFEAVSMVAVFPIEAFTEKYEVHVVYEAGGYGCSDCAFPIKLRGIR